MTRTDAPAPMRRRGPRPLLLHLLMAGSGASPEALTSWLASASKSQRSSGSLPDWPGSQPPPAIDPEFVHGIAAYRRSRWQRDVDDPPACWQEGGSRLLRFGEHGAPVVFVPSLVNRATVLDLLPGRSMMRWLAGRGVMPLLLDWGWPGEIERGFTLTDYVAGRLESAVASCGGPVILAGYCMGGLLALAAAVRRPDLVRGLALLATPWDFHAGEQVLGGRSDQLLALLEPALAETGTLPVDGVQALFALADPGGVVPKYRAFGRLDQESEAARRFVALEDWLNDGVPLAAPVARECLGGWYGGNSPMTGEWKIAGQAVGPAALRQPAFVAVPARDRIVPPESAGALVALLPDAVVHRPAAGHVGMVAGSRAEEALWRPLLEWLRGV